MTFSPFGVRDHLCIFGSNLASSRSASRSSHSSRTFPNIPSKCLPPPPLSFPDQISHKTILSGVPPPRAAAVARPPQPQYQGPERLPLPSLLLPTSLRFKSAYGVSNQPRTKSQA